MIFDQFQLKSCSVPATYYDVRDMAKKYGVLYPSVKERSEAVLSLPLSDPRLSEETNRYPSELAEANRQVFDGLLSAIWDKARLRTQRKE